MNNTRIIIVSALLLALGVLVILLLPPTDPTHFSGRSPPVQGTLPSLDPGDPVHTNESVGPPHAIDIDPFSPPEAQDTHTEALQDAASAIQSARVISREDVSILHRWLESTSDAPDVPTRRVPFSEKVFAGRLPGTALFEVADIDEGAAIDYYAQRLIDSLCLPSRSLSDYPCLASDIELLKESWIISALIHRRLEAIGECIAAGRYTDSESSNWARRRQREIRALANNAVVVCARLNKRVYDAYRVNDAKK